MRQQDAEYAVADIFSVAYVSLCSNIYLKSLDKPVSRAAHAQKCAATARLCSRALIQAVVGGLVVTCPTLKATLERVYVTTTSKTKSRGERLRNTL